MAALLIVTSWLAFCRLDASLLDRWLLQSLYLSSISLRVLRTLWCVSQLRVSYATLTCLE